MLIAKIPLRGHSDRGQGISAPVRETLISCTRLGRCSRDTYGRRGVFFIIYSTFFFFFLRANIHVRHNITSARNALEFYFFPVLCPLNVFSTTFNTQPRTFARRTLFRRTSHSCPEMIRSYRMFFYSHV